MIDKRIMILAIFLVSLFAISAVSAGDNATADEQSYNTKIVAKDINEEYDEINGNTMIFSINDLNGKPIKDAKPTVTYDNKKVKAVYDDDQYFSEKQGTYYLDRDPEIGNHKVKITLNTSKYQAKPVHECQNNQSNTKINPKKICNN